MMVDIVIERFIHAEHVPAALAGRVVPDRPGYYSIWIDNPDNLPRLYAYLLQEDKTNLIYVGIATKSLLKRLVEQDLHHKSPSTFFRGIGPILGYRPPKGSLAGTSNQNNYKFTKDDTASIIGWIESHLSVRVVEESPARADIEAGVIHKLRPLLNDTHNPASLDELAQLRKECREIAQSTV